MAEPNSGVPGTAEESKSNWSSSSLITVMAYAPFSSTHPSPLSATPWIVASCPSRIPCPGAVIRVVAPATIENTGACGLQSTAKRNPAGPANAATNPDGSWTRTSGRKVNRAMVSTIGALDSGIKDVSEAPAYNDTVHHASWFELVVTGSVPSSVSGAVMRRIHRFFHRVSTTASGATTKTSAPVAPGICSAGTTSRSPTA
mmetsp:Transcript_53571/g.142398  ORF Transcript_53571/g.142398 Transcript_53571/m.142398 type:complete len:201 (+) Transcript_53571:1834-2436(+)